VIEVEREAQDYLKVVSKKVRAQVSYFGSEKKRYQIEVPDKVSPPADFEMSSSKKGFKRYYDEKTKVQTHKIVLGV